MNPFAYDSKNPYQSSDKKIAADKFPPLHAVEARVGGHVPFQTVHTGSVSLQNSNNMQQFQPQQNPGASLAPQNQNYISQNQYNSASNPQQNQQNLYPQQTQMYPQSPIMPQQTHSYPQHSPQPYSQQAYPPPPQLQQSTSYSSQQSQPRNPTHPLDYVSQHKTELEIWDPYAWKQLTNSIEELKQAYVSNRLQCLNILDSGKLSPHDFEVYNGIRAKTEIHIDTITAALIQIQEVQNSYRQSSDVGSKSRVREALNSSLKEMGGWPEPLPVMSNSRQNAAPQQQQSLFDSNTGYNNQVQLPTMTGYNSQLAPQQQQFGYNVQMQQPTGFISNPQIVQPASIYNQNNRLSYPPTQQPQMTGYIHSQPQMQSHQPMQQMTGALQPISSPVSPMAQPQYQNGINFYPNQVNSQNTGWK